MKQASEVVSAPDGVATASPGWELGLGARATRAFLFGSVALVFAAHLALWLWVSWRRELPLTDLLNRWDSNHYSTIIRDGYSGTLWAFYPLYPMTVRALASVLGVERVQVLGAVFSSVLSLYFAATRRPVPAGLLAALCVLTRNQGVFVVAAASVLVALREEGPARRLRAFLLCGALGTLGFGCFLAFEYLASGSPLAFVEAQRGWNRAESVAAVFKTFVFGNPWQNTRSPYLLRYGVFWVFLLGTSFLARRQPALGLYAALSMGVMLLQGEVVNVFRFGTVVFPLLVFLGDRCARRPVWFQGAVVLTLLLLNLATARGYALGRWAY